MSIPQLPQRLASGFTLIEVLVTAIILAIGLLGLAALQARMVGSELDAYQRAHALILLADMTDRIKNQREAFKATFDANAAAILTAGTGDERTIGQGINQDCTSSGLSDVDRVLCYSAYVNRELYFWSQELKGAAVSLGTEPVGAMREALGCIERIGTNRPITLRVSIAWQGLTPTVEPPAALTCGSTVAALSGDNATVRRVAHVLVTLADLVSL